MKERIVAAVLIASMILSLSSCGGKSNLQDTISTKEYLSGYDNSKEIKANLLHAMDYDRIMPFKFAATEEKPLYIKAPLSVYVDDNEGNDGFLKSEMFRTTESYDEAQSFLYVVKHLAEDNSKHWYYYKAYLASPDFSLIFRIGDNTNNGTLEYKTDDITGTASDSLDERQAADKTFEEYLLKHIVFSENGEDDVSTVINYLSEASEPDMNVIYSALQNIDTSSDECKKHKNKELSVSDDDCLYRYDNNEIPETTAPVQYTRSGLSEWTDSLSMKELILVSPESAAKNIKNGSANTVVIREICGLDLLATYSRIGDVYTRIYRYSVIDLDTGKVTDWTDKYSTSSPTISISETDITTDSFGRNILNVAAYD
ncbi:MAG: hypothetical protein J6O50_09845 [Ruminiclostridium sp.]|nr:hypothetical protein [Ruminiclostridium sp.]